MPAPRALQSCSKLSFVARLENRRKSSTGGGIRTHTGVPAQRILSPQRLPFRHAGPCGEVSTVRSCHKRKEPGRPGRFPRSASSQVRFAVGRTRVVELASTTSKHLKTVSATFLSCDQSTWLV